MKIVEVIVLHLIKKCCVYTLQEKCPKCGSKTRTAHPPKFSAADKYGKYRRIARIKEKTNI